MDLQKEKQKQNPSNRYERFEKYCRENKKGEETGDISSSGTYNTELMLGKGGGGGG
jgi:hypothetical protein